MKTNEICYSPEYRAALQMAKKILSTAKIVGAKPEDLLLRAQNMVAESINQLVERG